MTSQKWALLSGLDVGADGDPYLDRLRLIRTPWFGIFLHHIHRADIERDPHDHPWTFASIVLTGSYMESVWPDKANPRRQVIRVRSRWSLRWLHRGAAHIITDISSVPLWTLVVVGPGDGEWGFWRAGQYTPWREYGYTRPEVITDGQ